MTKRPTFKEFKKKALTDPEVKSEYDALQAEFEVVDKMLMARKKTRFCNKERNK
jgi:hypothetical protein